MSEVRSKIILIPKQLRMDWMDAMATDKRVSATAFKVAGLIGTHFGNKSGMTYVSRETLADISGLSEATIKRAVMELSELGYLLIQRREIGIRKDGRKAYGAKGRGGANVYLPAVDAQQISATDRGQKLVDLVNRSWEETRNRRHAKQVTNDPLSQPKQVTDDPLGNPQSGSNGSPKQVTGDPPTLTSPSEKNSTRGCARANADALGAPGVLLRQQLGPDLYKSWFGEVSIESQTASTITLAAPGRFVANHIRQNYEDRLLAAWQAKHPSIENIIVISRKERAA
jgi:hypothetical protein